MFECTPCASLGADDKGVTLGAINNDFSLIIMDTIVMFIDTF